MPTPVVKIFRPVAIGTDDTWGLFKGADKIQAVDPGDPVTHDERGSCIQAASISTRQSYRIDRNFPDSMGTITEVRVWCRYNPQTSPSAKVIVGVALTGGPTWIESGDLSHGGWNWDDVSAALARPGGGGWTETDLRDTTFQFSIKLGTGQLWVRPTSLWLWVTYDPTDESAGAMPPEFPSRKLRRSRLPVGVMSAELRGDALDIDLLKDFEVSHSEGEKFGGGGWGEEEWERRHFRCFDEELELNKLTVQMKAFDLHDYICMLWFTGVAPNNVKSDEYFPDGSAFLHPGVTETFIRSGTAHILDGSNTVQQLASGFKRFSPDGLRLEAGQFSVPVKNEIINSSFFDGTTSWTLGGSGSDALDTAETLFSDEAQQALGGANRSLKFTTAGGAGTHRYVYQGISGFSSLNTGENGAFTVWRKDSNSNFPGFWAVQDQTTSKWYNATSGLWQVGFAANYFPAITDKFTRAVNLVPTEAASGDVWRFYVSSSNLGNNDSWYGHVQVEFNAFGGLDAGSSPIPTFDSTVARQHESLSWTNELGRRDWPTSRGTVIIRVKFFFDGPLTTWSAVPVPHETSGLGILCAYHGFFNWFYLNYNYDETLDFAIANPDGTDIAQINFTPTNEQTYIMAARWTSLTGGELSLPSGTLSVFLDGVKGTDVYRTSDVINDVASPIVAIGNPTIPTGELFGSISRFQEPLAAFSHLEIIPWCLTDEEIRARS